RQFAGGFSALAGASEISGGKGLFGQQAAYDGRSKISGTDESETGRGHGLGKEVVD
ncbi:MAG: hypothetical protein RL091_1783, partial [Verrucomicrobiota bacterium]